MTEKERCGFNGTWTSSVPTEDCADIHFSIWCSTLVQANLSVATSPLMLSTFFCQWASLTPFFIYHHRFSIRGSKAYLGDLFSSRCMHDKCMTCNLYDELAPRGVIYGHNSCMMRQEFLFLLKLYNRNFLSDDHYITYKSWIQDASRRAWSDAKRSIHPKGRF